MTAPPTAMPPPRMALLAMMLIAAGNFANFYVYDSLAPLAATLQGELGFSDTQLGTLGAIYSIPNMILLFFGGVAVDRWGVGRMATITAGICLLGALLTAASPQFGVMVIGRLLFGIGGETFNLCTLAAVAAWYPSRHTALAMGSTIAMGRAGSVAVDLSPTWAAGAYASGWQAPLLLAALLALLGFAATAWYWRLERRAGIRTNHAAAVQAPMRWREVFSFDRRFWYLTLLCVMWYAALLAFRSTFAIKYLQHAQGYSLEVAGQVVSLMFLAAIVTTPLFGWLSDRSGRQTLLLVLGAAMLPLAFAVMQFAAGHAAIGTVLFGISYAVVPSVMWPYTARIIDPARFGTAIGLMWVIQNAGIAGASYAAGWLNDRAGASAANPDGYGPMMLFFLVTSGLGLLFALMLWKGADRHTATAPGG